ncbi:MAG: PKD domain-containing protein [Thermodesulfobacteriota bacterium]
MVNPETFSRFYNNFTYTTLNDWSAFGLATVTEDGLQLCSDTGFGVQRGAWTCCIPPPDDPTCEERTDKSNVCDPDDEDCEQDLDNVVASANGEETELETQTDRSVNFTVDFESDNCSDLTYQWDFDDGSPVSNQQSPTHTYTEPGEYFPRVNISCSGGCDGAQLSGSDAVDVNVIGLEKTINGLGPDEKEDAEYFVDEELVIEPDVIGIEGEIIELEIVFEDELVAGISIIGGSPFVYTPDRPGVYRIIATYEDFVETWFIEVIDEYEIILSIFIPQNFAPNPPTSQDILGIPFRCLFPMDKIGIPRVFEGDERGFSDSTVLPNSSRVFQRIVIDSNNVTKDEIKGFGISRAYAEDALINDERVDSNPVSQGGDNDGVLQDCLLLDDEKQAVTNQGGNTIELIKNNNGEGNVDFTLTGVAFNPVGPPLVTQPINWNVRIVIEPDTKSYSIIGTHDCFPAYELFINNNFINNFAHMPNSHDSFTLASCLSGFSNINLNITGDIQ